MALENSLLLRENDCGSGKLRAATGKRLWFWKTGHWETNFSRREKLCKLKLPNRIDLNIYIIGAGAL